MVKKRVGLVYWIDLDTGKRRMLGHKYLIPQPDGSYVIDRDGRLCFEYRKNRFVYFSGGKFENEVKIKDGKIQRKRGRPKKVKDSAD